MLGIIESGFYPPVLVELKSNSASRGGEQYRPVASKGTLFRSRRLDEERN